MTTVYDPATVSTHVVSVERIGYLPFGEIYAGDGDFVTDRLFTGQRQDVTGLYHYGAREYDPVTGRFIQPDPIVPSLYYPQDLNRYTYVRNNPLYYVDDGGNEPISVAVIIIVALEVIDYGWTGWDILQDLRTLQDPCADEEEQFWARLSIGLAVGCELIEPDDLLPIGLPIDDFARRQLQSVAKRVFKEEGYEGLIRLFRKELGSEVGEKVLKALGVRTEDYVWRFKKALGRSPLSGHDLHHGFPQADKFTKWFRKAGIDIHAPENLFELPRDLHTRKPAGVHTNSPLGAEWNKLWEAFMKEKPEATAEEISAFLDDLAEASGISGYRVRIPK